MLHTHHVMYMEQLYGYVYIIGGNGCESNTPNVGSPRSTGFEVQAGHQTQSTPKNTASCIIA